MNGLFIIDKPIGLTSHGVVQAIRKKFGISKAGHLGTLDPIATGVLPVCVGKATRLAQYIPGSPKEYEGEIRFGFATDTYDRQGTPTTEQRELQSNEQQIRDTMQTLTGKLEQTPPAFSAKKIEGVPAYKRARKQQTVVIPASRVDVEKFDMVTLDGSLMTFRVVCSPGTYIRSLAHELGLRLGCGAHLTALRRTSSGQFRVEQAVELDHLEAGQLIPMNRLLEGLPRIEVSGIDESKVARGNPIPAAGQASLARIFNKEGEFIAIASLENGWAHPRVVLTSINSEISSVRL
jgi:tRNA pseudouridine55 synthase